MLSVNGLFQLDWDLSPVNKLQSAIHYSSQSYHLFTTLSQKLHGARDQAFIFSPEIFFPRDASRVYNRKIGPEAQSRAQSSIRSVCKLHFIFLDEFSKPKLAAQAS